VFAISPANGSEYLETLPVVISANVTDFSPQINVSWVIANVTKPDGLWEEIILVSGIGTTYNNTFTNTTLVGLYNITIIANNTDGYVNDTVKNWFRVKPACVNMTDPSPAQPPPLMEYCAGEEFFLGVDARSEFMVSTVFANILIPDDGIEQYQLMQTADFRNDTELENYPVNITLFGGSYNLSFKCHDFTDATDCTIKILNSSGNCVYIMFDDSPPDDPTDFDLDIETYLCIYENNTDYWVNFTRLNYSASHVVGVGYFLNSTYGNKNNSCYVLNDTATDHYKVWPKPYPFYGGYYSMFYNNTITGIYNVTFTSNSSCGRCCDNLTTSFLIKNCDAPTVILNYPPQNYYNDSSDPVNVTFDCSAMYDQGLDNISLYITDRLNSSFSLNATTLVSGTDNSSEWILELQNGNYTWNCLGYAEDGSFAWGNNNRSLKINFIGAQPVINTAMLAAELNVTGCSFSSSTYVPCTSASFNVSSDVNVIILSSMNANKISGSVENVVYGRVLIDGAVIVEEKLRTLNVVNDEGSTGLVPVLFNASTGEHNISLELRATGDGTVDVNDIDMSLVQLRTTTGNDVRGQISRGNYQHSSTSFVPAFSWLINTSLNTPLIIVNKQTAQSTGSARVDYYYEHIGHGHVSPSWARQIWTVTDTASMAGMFLHEGNIFQENNFSIQSKTTAGTITVNPS